MEEDSQEFCPTLQDKAQYVLQKYNEGDLRVEWFFDVEVDSLVAISQKMLNRRQNFETSLDDDEQKAMLKLTYPEAEQMFRRMVFNVLAKNCDDHTKNFSFRLEKEGKWELAPAYDVCFAYRPDSTWVSQHNLSVNGKRNAISTDDLIEVAKSMNIKKASQIIQQIKEVVSHQVS